MSCPPLSAAGSSFSPEDACKIFYVEKERWRAAQMVEEARRERKQRVEARQDALHRQEEERRIQRDQVYQVPEPSTFKP